MVKQQIVHFDLGDARAAHNRVYDVQVRDGGEWTDGGQLVVMRDMVLHNGKHIHTVDYHGPNHTLLMAGKEGDPTFRSRLNLTESGEAFVGTMSSGGVTQAVRGTGLQSVYRTQRHLKKDPAAPFEAWDDLTIKSEWVDNELKITYLLGTENISDRTRVTAVDRAKGETTLEMVAELHAPFRQNQFVIVLASGSHTFAGTYTDDDEVDYDWRGAVQAHPQMAAALTARTTRTAALASAAPDTSTLRVEDLDNISSIQVVTDDKGEKVTVDYAQTKCGTYFNYCLVNALDPTYRDHIYGHAYSLTPACDAVYKKNTQFFADHSVVGTGQMLYDNFATTPQYQDLLKRVKPDAMKTVWEAMGKDPKVAVKYQEASNDLYIAGFHDGVSLMQPFLNDHPEHWAEEYFKWLTDEDRLLTWQIQVASKQFDNVKTRIYEWYVKLQVLAPDKDYGQRFSTIAYAALLGVNYTKAQWSDDLKPFLVALIQNAIAGKVDPAVMDQVQQQAALENQELLKTLITTMDQVALLADGIAAAMNAYARKTTLQVAAMDPELARLVGLHIQGDQYKVWNQLTASGRVFGVLGMLFYGASAGYLLYQIVQDSKNPATPKSVIEDINLGMLAVTLFVKGIEKLMSLGVGKVLQEWGYAGNSTFRYFAEGLATWFEEGGIVTPRGPLGRALVAVFGENSAVFLAKRVGPAMAVVGLILSGFVLYEAIKSGNVRTIVFESINAFLSLATVVLIGLELLSVGWAGPVGLAVAAVGIVVMLIQFIWNLIDPPKPPADPITNFVNGPMVAAGFATA